MFLQNLLNWFGEQSDRQFSPLANSRKIRRQSATLCVVEVPPKASIILVWPPLASLAYTYPFNGQRNVRNLLHLFLLLCTRFRGLKTGTITFLLDFD